MLDSPKIFFCNKNFFIYLGSACSQSHLVTPLTIYTRSKKDSSFLVRVSQAVLVAQYQGLSDQFKGSPWIHFLACIGPWKEIVLPARLIPMRLLFSNRIRVS